MKLNREDEVRWFIYMACYARINYLERKRFTHGVFTPLDGKEQEEYNGLRTWWHNIGDNNRLNIENMAKVTAADIAFMDQSLLITPEPMNVKGN